MILQTPNLPDFCPEMSESFNLFLNQYRCKCEPNDWYKKMELIFWALMATENGFGNFLLFKKIPFRKGKVNFSNLIDV